MASKRDIEQSSSQGKASEQSEEGDNSIETTDTMVIERSATSPSIEQTVDYQCANCLQLKAQLQQIERHLEREYSINADWTKKYDSLYQRIADRTRNSSVMERTNDLLSNTRLAEMFDVNVKKHWMNLCEELQDSKPPEIHRINNISELMKGIYTICTFKIEEDEKRLAICTFSENGEVPKEVELAVRMARRRICQTEDHRKKIIEEIGSAIRESELFRVFSVRSETQDTLEQFIDKVIDISWLMVTSDPPLYLNYDVKDKMYDGEIKERFVKYSTDEPVKPIDGKEGTVLVVAWPCVELKEHSGYLKKGEVIVLPTSQNKQTDIY